MTPPTHPGEAVEVRHLAAKQRRLALAGALWMQRYIAGATATVEVSGGGPADLPQRLGRAQANGIEQFKTWVRGLDVPALLATAPVSFDEAPDVSTALEAP